MIQSHLKSGIKNLINPYQNILIESDSSQPPSFSDNYMLSDLFTTHFFHFVMNGHINSINSNEIVFFPSSPPPFIFKRETVSTLCIGMGSDRHGEGKPNELNINGENCVPDKSGKI